MEAGKIQEDRSGCLGGDDGSVPTDKPPSDTGPGGGTAGCTSHLTTDYWQTPLK